MRKLGIGMIFAGLVAVPLGLILLVLLGSNLKAPDSSNAVAGLIVLCGGGITGGVMLLLIDARFRSGNSN